MWYRILADLTVLAHFLWILFLIFGSLWGRKGRWARAVHIAGLAFAVVIQAFDWYCPLTHLEVWLRSKHAAETAYAGSYLIHYIEKAVYLEVPQAVIVGLTILLCLFNLWAYCRR